MWAVLAILGVVAVIWALIAGARAVAEAVRMPRDGAGPRPGALATMFAPAVIYLGAAMASETVADHLAIGNALLNAGPPALVLIAALGWRERRAAHTGIVRTAVLSAMILTVAAWAPFGLLVGVASLDFSL